MTTSLFIKMAKEDSSLERLLGALRGKGCDVMEFSARQSLDNSLFFVRVRISGQGAGEAIERDIAALKSIRQVERETMVMGNA